MSAKLSLFTWAMLSFLGTLPSDAADAPALLAKTKPAVVEIVPPDQQNNVLQFFATDVPYFPELQKKVLAMYNHASMQLSKIAAVFGVTEFRIYRIREQAVAVLREYFRKLLA
jgi:DNA-directed RNA polymerase specialized sigma subunit